MLRRRISYIYSSACRFGRSKLLNTDDRSSANERNRRRKNMNPSGENAASGGGAGAGDVKEENQCRSVAAVVIGEQEKDDSALNEAAAGPGRHLDVVASSGGGNREFTTTTTTTCANIEGVRDKENKSPPCIGGNKPSYQPHHVTAAANTPASGLPSYPNGQEQQQQITGRQLIDKSTADEMCQLKVSVATLQERLSLKVEVLKSKLEDAEEREKLKLEVERLKLENVTQALKRSQFDYLCLTNKLHPRCVMELFEDRRSTPNQKKSLPRELLWSSVILLQPDVDQAMKTWPHGKPVAQVAAELYRQLSTSIHTNWSQGMKVIVDLNYLTPADADLLQIICLLLPIDVGDIQVIQKIPTTTSTTTSSVVVGII